MIKAMQQWVHATTRRLTKEGCPDAALIYAIDRAAQRAVGYCWGISMPKVGATERMLAAINSAGNALDSTGAQAANKVWERGGCVTVSVWTKDSYRERHFRRRICASTGATRVPPLKELVGVVARGYQHAGA
jgi:hypothetical protein